MNKIKIVRKGIFENYKKFEARLNSLSLEGWSPLSIAYQGAIAVVLMEKK